MKRLLPFRTSGEARRHWSLVIQFCQLHHIKLSTSYLRACARSNEWLQFVTEAQMHGYQPAEVGSCWMLSWEVWVEDAPRQETRALQCHGTAKSQCSVKRSGGKGQRGCGEQKQAHP